MDACAVLHKIVVLYIYIFIYIMLKPECAALGYRVDRVAYCAKGLPLVEGNAANPLRQHARTCLYCRRVSRWRFSCQHSCQSRRLVFFP